MKLHVIRDFFRRFRDYMASPAGGQNLYIWESQRLFQERWSDDARDLRATYDASLDNSHSRRLWNREHFEPKRAMLQFMEEQPDYIRAMFLDLFDERKAADTRCSRFSYGCDQLLAHHREHRPASPLPDHYHGQDYHMISLYLTFRYPDRYALYEFDGFRQALRAFQAPKLPQANDLERFFKLMRTLYTLMQKEDGLLEVHRQRLDPEKHYLGPSLLLVYDLYQFVKRTATLALVLVTLGLFSCRPAPPPPERPNILLIMADDIGFSDIGPFGAEINTPHLDRLAEEGMRLTQFYNMSKCETTRSAMITGLYRGDARARSMGQLLRQAGYFAITSGKEHFSRWVPQHVYAENSFDRSFTFWATTEYFVPPDSAFRRPFLLAGRQVHPREIEAEQQPLYKTDFITDYALRWLDTTLQREQPFFLYLPYHSAHYPLQARPEDIARYRGQYRRGWDAVRQERFRRMKDLGVIPGDAALSPPTDNVNAYRGHPDGFPERRAVFPLYRPWEELSAEEQDELDLEMAVFAAMIDRMDQNIGRVLERLERAGQLDNTLVLFLTDNGSCPYDSNVDFDIPPGPAHSFRCLSAAWANVGNTPFRYFKQFGHEGGAHTHFLARWPGRIPAGSRSEAPAHVVDILPTLLEAAGASYPDSVDGHPALPLPGRSLLPVLEGGERPEPEFMISGFSERFRMYREGPWKIVRLNEQPWELYNLADDPTELADLAADAPGRVTRLEKNYQDRMAAMLPDTIRERAGPRE